MSPSGKASLSYCAQLVRDHDPDRYLATLFAPPKAREALFGLYAFDHEIAKVRQLVTQPMAGLIRLQWWREALEAIAADRPAPAHPVAEALQRAQRDFDLSRARLDGAIDARERELEDDPPASLELLEQRLEASSSGVVRVALEILGATDERSFEAGRRLGLARGLTSLLGEVEARPEQALLLPKAVLDRHGIASAALGQAGSSRALEPVLQELAGRAREHLNQARRYRRAVPRRALPALLPGALVDARLRHLRAGRSGEAGRPAPRSALAPLKLLWYRLLGVF